MLVMVIEPLEPPLHETFEPVTVPVIAAGDGVGVGCAVGVELGAAHATLSVISPTLTIYL